MFIPESSKEVPAKAEVEAEGGPDRGEDEQDMSLQNEVLDPKTSDIYQNTVQNEQTEELMEGSGIFLLRSALNAAKSAKTHSQIARTLLLAIFKIEALTTRTIRGKGTTQGLPPNVINVIIGTAYDMPLHYSLHQNLTNPDEYKALFTTAVMNSVSVIGVTGAITRPPAPVFVSLPSLPSTWESLQVIIPTVLTFGIIGYPFLMPGPVGGDYVIKDPQRFSIKRNSSLLDFDFTFTEFMDKGLPNKELYVRWLQLATFLPVIRYSTLPSEYKDDDQVLELAKVLTALRQKMVNPLLKKYAQEALDLGTPLVRPLWMLDPGDSACHLVKDEFSVGEELIVAPILRANTHEREVYLPAGVWKDGIDGSLRKGSRWIHHYKVPLEKIAYFLKMPDNTRF